MEGFHFVRREKETTHSRIHLDFIFKKKENDDSFNLKLLLKSDTTTVF